MNMDNNIQALIVMGVSGCGKTTIGKRLAKRLSWTFIESDEYHSTEDVRKMSSGIPLNNADRQPWLEKLHAVLQEHQQRGQQVVIACSALKETYRQTLTAGLEGVQFVYLKGDFEMIHSRMHKRSHFMKAAMLQSQFDTLEEPTQAFQVDISEPPDSIVDIIMNGFRFSTR